MAYIKEVGQQNEMQLMRWLYNVNIQGQKKPKQQVSLEEILKPKIELINSDRVTTPSCPPHASLSTICLHTLTNFTHSAPLSSQKFNHGIVDDGFEQGTVTAIILGSKAMMVIGSQCWGNNLTISSLLLLHELHMDDRASNYSMDLFCRP